MTDERTFQLEEYKALRKEVEIYLQESRSQERYTLIAIGAIWAWLIVNHLSNGWLWAAPILLTLATTIRMGAILRHFSNMGGYIKKLESVFVTKSVSNPEALGWEHQKRSWTFGLAYTIIDGALLLLAGIGWWFRDQLAALPGHPCKP